MCFKSGLKDAQGGGEPNNGWEAVPECWAGYRKSSVTLLPEVGRSGLKKSLARGSQYPCVIRGGQKFCNIGWCESI